MGHKCFNDIHFNKHNPVMGISKVKIIKLAAPWESPWGWAMEIFKGWNLSCWSQIPHCVTSMESGIKRCKFAGGGLAEVWDGGGVLAYDWFEGPVCWCWSINLVIISGQHSTHTTASINCCCLQMMRRQEETATFAITSAPSPCHRITRIHPLITTSILNEIIPLSSH